MLGDSCLAGERRGQLHPSMALGEVPLVEPLHAFEVVSQGPCDRLRPHGDPICAPFPIPDGELVLCESEGVNPQARAFH